MDRSHSDELAAPARGGLAIVGLALVGFSLWALFDNVQISGGLFASWGLGQRGFGWSLVPLLIGVMWVVANRRSVWAWGLIVVGIAILVLEVLSSLVFYFRPVSLNTLLLMVVPGAAGLALLAKYL